MIFITMAVFRNASSIIHRFFDVDRNNYEIITHLFLRFLALVYLIAFTSLWIQIDGLIGSQGILPVQNFLERVFQQVGADGYWRLPTLFWLNASDGFLNLICLAGIILSALGMLLPFSTILWILLWILYLSLVKAGQIFLSFQWDILLLEAGFLVIFLMPFRIFPRRYLTSAPSAIVTWLYRWLLFRLMFSSAVVKLTSGDPTWRDLTALNFHYFTQPLPPWTAWYIHQLPEWFHKLSTAGMFFIELAIPFLIFAPRRFRWIGGIGIIFLQVLIILTGNYCFFNILSIILCVWLLDDSTFCPKWQTKLKKFFQDDLIPKSSPSRSRWRWLGYPASGILVLISLMILSSATFRIQVKWPGALNTLYSVQSPFHMVNSYGLFANMTTERPEIIIEGSNDGETWTPYSFKFKPGNPDKKPSFVAPHQPRLDWHMWFAALGSVNQNVWVVNLCVRLLQGSEPVTSLLRQNPFPDNPPRYIRAQLYNYRFTNFEERQQTGHWWKREFKREYLPPISRQQLDRLSGQLGLDGD